MSTAAESKLLLLSGGHDSIALAAWLLPAACLTIDYGQRPVKGEMRAASAAADALGLAWHELRVDLSAIGSGLMHDSGDDEIAGSVRLDSPSPEWWPYRNQLLATLAAAWALPRGFSEIVVGSVRPDGMRHRDATPEFYERLDAVVAYQEGGVRITAPAVGMSTRELIELSDVADGVLAYAHSCHLSEYPCGLCPGCRKHADVLAEIGRLQ